MEQEMVLGTAQAQAVPPLPDISVWDMFVRDPGFLAINLVVLLILIPLLLIVRRRYSRFFKIQREALDHRKASDAKALAHSQSMEELIAGQYGVINTHNQQVMARAEEAVRISAQMLAQIATVNESLTRIANRLDRITGPAA